MGNTFIYHTVRRQTYYVFIKKNLFIKMQILEMRSQLLTIQTTS